MSHAKLDEQPRYRYQDSSSGSDSDSQCNDKDSKLKFPSSLPVPSPTLRQCRENRFTSPSFYGHNYENDPRVFSSTKAFSASNRADDYVDYVPCFRYDVESRDWDIKYYRKSTTVKQAYRVLSHDVTAAILVSQNNEMAAMLVSQTNPLGVELFSYANAFFSSNKFAYMLAT